MIVLWGARKGDIQFGSYEDRERQRWLKTLAVVTRGLRENLVLFRSPAVRTAGEVAVGFAKARRALKAHRALADALEARR